MVTPYVYQLSDPLQKLVLAIRRATRDERVVKDYTDVHQLLVDGGGKDIAEAARRAPRDLLRLTLEWQTWAIGAGIDQDEIDQVEAMLTAQMPMIAFPEEFGEASR